VVGAGEPPLDWLKPGPSAAIAEKQSEEIDN
jgi:hypothetical protein